MASLPAQQQAPRRSSPEQSSEPAASPTAVRSRSAHSEDSQTVFLNSPKNESAQTPEQPQTPQPHPGDEDGEPLKCWICFADSTEDTPETSPWRDPCPCALVAHEECLLDWIADTEAPNNRRRGIAAPKIECPQCKSEIKIARPRDFIVEAVRGIERIGATATTPAALTLLSSTFYKLSMFFGIHSIYAVFGPDDGQRILSPLIHNIVRPPVEFDGGSAQHIAQEALGVLRDHAVHWRLYAGVPLIGPLIILSRSTIADSVMPVLPVLFFATQMHAADERFDFPTWPPSASLAFTVLPYLRMAYNHVYRQLFAEKEKQWLREIQPRAGQAQAEGGNGEGDAPVDDNGDGNVFEVRIDGDIFDDWEDERGLEEMQNQPAPAQRPQVQEQAIPPPPPQQQQEDQADPPADIADNRPNFEAIRNAAQPQQQQAGAQQQPQPQAAQPPAERRLSFSPTSIASSILGALLFPSIASLSGELLKLALPYSWTTSQPQKLNFLVGARISGSKGLLQEKWGRSLVGGCLFVVLKDAVVLYARWRMLGLHRARRVVDVGDRVTRGSRTTQT